MNVIESTILAIVKPMVKSAALAELPVVQPKIEAALAKTNLSPADQAAVTTTLIQVLTDEINSL